MGGGHPLEQFLRHQFACVLPSIRNNREAPAPAFLADHPARHCEVGFWNLRERYYLLSAGAGVPPYPRQDANLSPHRLPTPGRVFVGARNDSGEGIEEAMTISGSRRERPKNMADHLTAQAERARKMGAEAGIDHLADLYNIHAQACDLRAKSPQRKRGKKAAARET
jgi:hypothetical protein